MIRRLLVILALAPLLASAQLLDLDGSGPELGEDTALRELAAGLQQWIDEHPADDATDADGRAVRSMRAAWRAAAISLLEAASLREPPDAMFAASAMRIAREGRTLDALAASLLSLEPGDRVRVRASFEDFARAAARFEPRGLIDRSTLDDRLADLFSRLNEAAETVEGIRVSGGWLPTRNPGPIPREQAMAVIDGSNISDRAKDAARQRMATLIDAERFPQIRRAARTAANQLAAAVELPAAIGASRNTQSSPAQARDDVERAVVLSIDPASVDRASRALRGLADSRRMLARVETLLGAGPSLGTLRPVLPQLYDAADALARNPAPDPDAQRVLAAIDEYLERLQDHRARRAGEEPPRELRLAWRAACDDVERISVSVARALIEAANAPQAINRPATVSAITDHARAVEAEARLLRVPSIVATLESFAASESAAAVVGVWRLVEQHADDDRRPWAMRQFQRLEEQLDTDAAIPPQWADPAYLAARAAWLAAWEDGDPDETPRDLAFWATLAHLRIDADFVLSATGDWPIRRWAACAIEPVDLHPLATRLADALDSAESALLSMQPTRRADTLAELETQGAIVRITADLARVVSRRTSFAPVAVKSVGRLSIPPPPDALLLDRRDDLDQLSLWSLELAHAERRADAELARSIVEYLEPIAARVRRSLERAVVIVPEPDPDPAPTPEPGADPEPAG